VHKVSGGHRHTRSLPKKAKLIFKTKSVHELAEAFLIPAGTQAFRELVKKSQ
jgi:hypothetical protein